uniref:Thioredoxin domain-containing protein n=1 Tax=Panagrolaimus davidi TaxID=227884 RepID=A0A914QHN5_9BILA
MKVTFLFLIAIVAVFCKEEVDLSHGFGEDIDWVSWDNALDLAKEQNKPVFLLIHKTWCGACKALKKNFKGSNKRTELLELSKKFVMVNLEDDEEPDDERYAPDGAYIPRLFFLGK